MAFLDTQEIAEARAAMVSVLTDTAHVLRAETGAQAAAAATVPGSGLSNAPLSNGAGGVRAAVNPNGTPTAAAQAAWRDVAQYPCRLGSYPRGLGEFLAGGAAQGKSSYRLKLPHDAQVLLTDRVRVVSEDSDAMYEVVAVEPRSSQFLLVARLTRIN